MIAKFFAPLVCYLFGHDKIFPHVNRKCWSCVRCEDGPDDRTDRMFQEMYRAKNSK